MKRYSGFFVLAISLMWIACETPEKVSPIPEITFKSLVLEDYVDSLGNESKIGTLKFDFIDGDADIGSYMSGDPAEDTATDLYNLFLIPFQKLPGGIYDTTDLDTLKYIIRHDDKLDRVGQNKTVKGEIQVIIQYALVPHYDTLRYELFILDRARHKSNVEYTTDIGFH